MAVNKGGDIDVGSLTHTHRLEDSSVATDRRALPRQSSAAILKSNLAGWSEISLDPKLNSSRVNALRAMVNGQTDAITKALLTSKDSAEKRATIESAFRTCRDAFMEVSIVLLNILDDKFAKAGVTVGEVRQTVSEIVEEHEERLLSDMRNIGCTAGSVVGVTVGEVRHAVSEIMEEHEERLLSEMRNIGGTTGSITGRARSYASVVGSGGAEVHVSGGPSIELENTTSFMIVPDPKQANKYTSSQAVKETLCKVLKPSDCGLKVKRITQTNKNAVKIEAFSPDLKRISKHPSLLAAGLTVKESVKLNPRIIVHGVPVNMSAEEISKEITAQNLHNCNYNENNLKVIYIFPPKQDKRSTSCIIEVTPDIRSTLLKCGRIFLRYASCNFADHIRITQCFRCLQFGHLAKNCKAKPSCGYCAEGHEMRDCNARDRQPKCVNCNNFQGTNNNITHMATDGKLCPILCRKIKDKIANINYG